VQATVIAALGRLTDAKAQWSPDSSVRRQPHYTGPRREATVGPDPLEVIHRTAHGRTAVNRSDNYATILQIECIWINWPVYLPRVPHRARLCSDDR